MDKYDSLVQKTAVFLHTHGYSCPACIDVMLDKAGRQFIVDLDPRITGSFVLGCLRTHFIHAIRSMFAEKGFDFLWGNAKSHWTWSTFR